MPPPSEPYWTIWMEQVLGAREKRNTDPLRALLSCPANTLPHT